MASFILILSLIVSFLSSADSLTCSSQSFQTRSFAHCDDLPHLNAFLHWTYNPNNSSLSVAFLASPPRSAGWVAWAINPTSTGMAGSQAFIAFLSGGTPTVRTFNISSYSSVLPSLSLSFPAWDLAVEFSGGRLTIFVTVKVPEKATSVNQVWQVGSAVGSESGVPAVHEFKSANLNARSVLVVDKKSGVAPPPAVRVNGTATAGSDKGGVAGVRSGNLGFVVGLFVLIMWGIVSF